MTINYLYPTNSELQLIDRELQLTLTMDDPIFDIMPIVDVNAFDLLWDIPANVTGLTNLRGLNGQPGNVAALGGNRYRVAPGVYGEFMTVDEEEMTRRAELGTYNVPINVDDLVRDRQDQLIQRRIDRIRYVGWLLVATGTFSVINNNGITHTDTFDLQDYNASTWATVATATPLADFRGAKLLQRGKGVSFGAQATAYMNQSTFNSLTANTNAADLYGKRTAGLAIPQGVNDVNVVLMNEDLPQIKIYDEGYLDSTGAFQLFLPTGKVSIVGRRPGGQKIADFAMVRNANNPNVTPGPYDFVNNHTSGPAKTVPPTIEVHSGFNGGPRIYYPGAIIDMDVS
jgi:hypothetical protein